MASPIHPLNEASKSGGAALGALPHTAQDGHGGCRRVASRGRWRPASASADQIDPTEHLRWRVPGWRQRRTYPAHYVHLRVVGMLRGATPQPTTSSYLCRGVAGAQVSGVGDGCGVTEVGEARVGEGVAIGRGASLYGVGVGVGVGSRPSDGRFERRGRPPGRDLVEGTAQAARFGGGRR